MRTIYCLRCGSEVVTNHAMQKYCRACSEVKDLERKRVWARAHPPSKENVQHKRHKSIVRQQERGKENSVPPNSIAYVADHELPDLQHIIRVAVPFDYGYSKNSIYRMVGAGHVVLREETKALRDLLCLKLREATGGKPFYNAKVYLDIMVEKPDHKGDAVNVLDTVCDAIKQAIGVDDRWYSVRLLDWRIVKQDGRLIVGVAQSATEDERVCHRCGRVFPLSYFSGIKRKSRVCRECSRA